MFDGRFDVRASVMPDMMYPSSLTSGLDLALCVCDDIVLLSADSREYRWATGQRAQRFALMRRLAFISPVLCGSDAQYHLDNSTLNGYISDSIPDRYKRGGYFIVDSGYP
jgi:hypothetical protein